MKSQVYHISNGVLVDSLVIKDGLSSLFTFKKLARYIIVHMPITRHTLHLKENLFISERIWEIVLENAE